MPTIRLKAKLQAYSRAPFYGDYIRQPSGVLGDDFDPNIIYVLKDGNWIDLAKAASDTGASIDELLKYIQKVETDLGDDIRTVSCSVDYDKQSLKFIDSNRQEYFYVLPSAKTDNISIGLNQDNLLETLDKPDEQTIKVVDVIYENDDLGINNKKISGKLRVEGIYDIDRKTIISGSRIQNFIDKAEKNIKDLETYIQGKGGFLDPYNFMEALGRLDEQTRNSILNQYAYNQLSNGEPAQIPDQTKIKNLFDGHIWVYVQESDSWVDEGADTVVTANNEGVLGAVTGVEYDPDNWDTKFKISIDKEYNPADGSWQSTGTMTVNGLAEEFDKVIYKTETDSDSAEPNTYVRRTDRGTILTAACKEDSEAVNQGQINNWIYENEITSAEIIAIVNAAYLPEIGDAYGDVDVDIDQGPDSFGDDVLYEL